jgi:SPP1 family predicted phage head-tail adaptor
VRVGRLRHRVTIQAETATADAGGGYAATWADVATVWARIEAMAGRELVLGGVIRGDASHRVTMRYRSGVSPDSRLVYDGRVFDVLSVANTEERDEVLTLMCREVVS